MEIDGPEFFRMIREQITVVNLPGGTLVCGLDSVCDVPMQKCVSGNETKKCDRANGSVERVSGKREDQAGFTAMSPFPAFSISAYRQEGEGVS